jgi:2-methylaconitate cis-trans-isomerase PrpF
MTGHIAFAEGSPCPTLVLDGRALPPGGPGLLAGLAAVRTDLDLAGYAHVLKNALIQPSGHPLFDLDYHFVQSLPGGPDRFDLRGSCGHSILSSVLVAARTGMIAPLSAGSRVRVNVTNNGDNVVCDIEEVSADSARFTVHFLRSPATPVKELLMTGDPVTRLVVGGADVDVSMVSMGNPYVFVSAEQLGVTTRQDLFAEDPAWFATLCRVREAACALLGWDPAGAFPKIAALLPDGPGLLAARAISVPSWHPTLALTGAIALGTAIRIPGTLPAALAERVAVPGEPVRLRTPGGELRVTARTAGPADALEVAWVSIGGKPARFVDTVALPALPPLPISPKDDTWLPLPV